MIDVYYQPYHQPYHQLLPSSQVGLWRKCIRSLVLSLLLPLSHFPLSLFIPLSKLHTHTQARTLSFSFLACLLHKRDVICNGESDWLLLVALSSIPFICPCCHNSPVYLMSTQHCLGEDGRGRSYGKEDTVTGITQASEGELNQL